MSPRKAGDIGHSTRLVSDDVIDSQPACAQAVFALLFTTLRRLAMPGSPCYRVCLSILDTISQVRSNAVADGCQENALESASLAHTKACSQVKCCVLIVDNDDDGALCDLTQVLLDTIKCGQPSSRLIA